MFHPHKKQLLDLFHYVTRGLSAHVLQEMVSFVVSIIGQCERGDDYSEAKIITELRALALSLVASQTHHLVSSCR